MIWNYGFGFPWFFFGWIFWIVIFCLIFALFIGRGHRHRGEHWRHWVDHLEGSQDPLEIVKERYAKGEIKKEEFDRIKKDLQDSQ
jgi:putative membrane protein